MLARRSLSSLEHDGWTLCLGNDAEYPLGFGYASLVVRWLATTLPTDLLRGGATERAIQVGFDSGDFLQIGTLRESGLVFPADRVLPDGAGA